MNLGEALKAKIGAAIETGAAATAEDLLNRYPMLVTLTPDLMGYSNPRVTASVDSLSDQEITHLKCIPLVEDGLVIILPAKPEEQAAVEFVRGDSRRTGSFSLRAALVNFNISFSDERKLKFEVAADEAPTTDGTRKFLAIKVKRPSAKKTVSRPRKNKAAKAAAKPTPEAPAQAPAPAEQPAAEQKE